MKLEDLTIVVVHDKKSQSYCAYFEKFKGIVVQIDKEEDAIPELLKSLKVMMLYAKEKGLIKHIEY